MDVMKKVDDLANLILDEKAADRERINAAVGMVRLIREYKLLGKKSINVATEILDRFTSPDFVEGVVSRAEKFADGFERVLGSAKKVSGQLAREKRGNGRRYGGRGR